MMTNLSLVRSKDWLPALLLLPVPLLAGLILGGDLPYYIIWWLVWTLCGWIFWPLAAFFAPGRDAGYALAKILGPLLIMLTVTWFCTPGFLPFTRFSLFALLLAAAVICWGLPQLRQKFYRSIRADLRPQLIIAEELIFALLLLLWTFARGLKPELDSLEKMMNIGFINSLWRSNTLPALDMWFAGGTINYYYGGHILTGIMMKLSGIKPQISYNLALASTLALTGTLSFAVGFNLLARSCRERKKFIPWLAGGLVAVLVCFGGNGHAILYDPESPLHPLLQVLSRINPALTGTIDSFWFSDSTRFIGHNPPLEDFTIHEFPYYSFLVADLHAHVLNLACVIGLLLILTALWQDGWLKERAELWQNKLISALAVEKQTDSRSLRTALAWAELKNSLLDARIWLLSAILAAFMITNYWDFVIYFALIAWLSWLVTRDSGLPLLSLRALPVFLLQIGLLLLPYLLIQSPLLALVLYVPAAAINHFLLIPAADRLSLAAAKTSLLFALAHAIALPFNLNFSALSKTILLTDRRTSLYQFLVVWGVMLGACLIWWLGEMLISRWRSRQDTDSDSSEAESVLSSGQMSILTDDRRLLAALLSAAIVLLLIPELVYVKDIYGASFQRSNTMFKFTYQAFVLLMITWGAGLARLIANWWQSAAARVLAMMLAIAMLVPLWYPVAATEQWLGEFRIRNYQSLDGTIPLRTKNSAQISGDNAAELQSYFNLIDWLNENVSQQPVLVEAVSVSYSDFNLVSAFTGLPTIIGWPTHEWLWRQTPETPDAWGMLVGPRVGETEQIYNDPDQDKVKELLLRYQVEYIVIGPLERELYSGHRDIAVANEFFLSSLGTVVFTDSDLYLIRLNPPSH